MNRVANLQVWADKIRQLYKNLKLRESQQKAGEDISKPKYSFDLDPTNPISEEEFTELRDMGFIFETNLSAYFDAEPSDNNSYFAREAENRAYLINVLTELQKNRSGKK